MEVVGVSVEVLGAATGDLLAGVSSVGGMSTLSMMWMIPLLAMTSAVATVASFTITPPSETVTSTESPLRVSTLPLDNPELRALAATTWYLRISTSWSMFSGSRRFSTVPSGRAAKASLVGAKQKIMVRTSDE